MTRLMQALRPVAAALTLALAAAPALAGRPLAAEDAGVLGRGECEIESFFGRAGARGEASVRTGSLQLGCGVGAQTQLALAAARSRADGTHADELTLTGKSFLRELTDDQAGIALRYVLAGAREAGGSLRHARSELTGVLSVPRGDWLLHANLGWVRAEQEQLDSALWALGVERTGIGAVDLMAEAFGDDRSGPWLNAGVRWHAVPGRLALDASYGVQIDGARTRLLTIGLKAGF